MVIEDKVQVVLLQKHLLPVDIGGGISSSDTAPPRAAFLSNSCKQYYVINLNFDIQRNSALEVNEGHLSLKM